MLLFHCDFFYPCTKIEHRKNKNDERILYENFGDEREEYDTDNVIDKQHCMWQLQGRTNSIVFNTASIYYSSFLLMSHWSVDLAAQILTKILVNKHHRAE